MRRIGAFLNISAICLLLGQASASELDCGNAAEKCDEMGYETNIGSCSKPLSCPFDTSYQICLDSDYNLTTCPEGATCEKKYKVSGCPTLTGTTGGTATLKWNKKEEKCTGSVSKSCDEWSAPIAFGVAKDNPGGGIVGSCDITLNGCNTTNGRHVNKYTVTTNGLELVEENKCKSTLEIGTSSYTTINLEAVKTFYVVNIEDGGNKFFKFIVDTCESGYKNEGNKCTKPYVDTQCEEKEGHPYYRYIQTEFVIGTTTYRLYNHVCCESDRSWIGNISGGCVNISDPEVVKQ